MFQSPKFFELEKQKSQSPVSHWDLGSLICDLIG
jgi:hypothetical protein